MDSPPRLPASSSYLSQRLPWLLLLLALVALVYRTWSDRTASDATAEPRTVTPRGDLAADERSTIELFRRSSRSVVYIATKTVRRDAYSFNLLEIPRGTGTGFIWDDLGHVVTNFHVIEGANSAKITLTDHTSYDAELVGYAADKDLAVLQISAPKDKLVPIVIGSSHDLDVGQKVFAIGNPFGLDQTLTTGVISGLGREIKSVVDTVIQGVIQTDAAINPGNSGGPLLDSSGRMIGVNTAIYSPTGTYAGVGYAVPVATVNNIVPQLIKYHKVIRPGLGATFLPDHVARRLRLSGVLVLKVASGGAAEKAGVQPTRDNSQGLSVLGDLIVALDGQPVKSTADLDGILELHDVGQTVSLTVLRGGRQLKLDVTLQAE